MATGTAATAPMHTVRRMSAVGGDVDQRIEAIGEEAEAEPQSVVGMPTGAQVPDDPFASLRRVAGWAVDYVAFLREPIDQLQGDPQGVRAVVDALRSTAERMRELAETQRETLAKPEGWTGSTRDAYQASMDALGEELASLAKAVDRKGVVVDCTGAMVQALREALCYTLGRYSDSLVPGAINAYAFAPFTAGASIALFLCSVVDSATQLGRSVAAKMEDLTAALTRQVERIKELDRITDEVGRGWERFEAAADGGKATATASTTARRMLAVDQRQALRPDRAVRLPAAEEAEALRPTHTARTPAAEETVALRPMSTGTGERLLPEESIAFSRAEEPLRPRQVLPDSTVHAPYAEAEPFTRADHAVQAEPLMQRAYAETPVRYEQPLQPVVRATEPAAPDNTVRAVDARGAQATPEATVRRVVETE